MVTDPIEDTSHVLRGDRAALRLAAALVLAAATMLGSAAAAAAASGPVLTVRDTAGVARQRDIVRSGVPIPRGLNVLDTAGLTLVDGTGVPVPAEFQVLARWHAGKSVTTAPVQWLLVTFRASVASHGSTSYRLVTDGSAGSNPAPPVSVSLTRAGNQVTVDTGAAVFTLGGDSGALFDEIRRAGGARLVAGGALTTRVGGVDAQHPVTRRVSVEHAGPLAAIVVVEGAYDLPPVGGGQLSSRRRYVFTAGSPTAVVRHVVRWEGDRCGTPGTLACDGAPNAVSVARVRDALTLDLNGSLSVTAVSGAAAAAVHGVADPGQTAHVRQLRRPSRTAPLAFDVDVPGGAGDTGQKADGGMLAVSGAEGAVTVALERMHRYEPQALRLLADGRLAVDVADDQVWLGARQGLFATLAVSALPPAPSRAELDRLVWAPLNHPLRAWPTPEWFADSGAVEEVPLGPLPPALAGYDTHVASVLSATREGVDAKGLAGLMTFGLYPRLWGNALYGDELDCGGGDPTPGAAWDDTYWCATWTDYHGTVATAPAWAMRSGETSVLDEIAVPGALRSLHTQVWQCGPDDDTFYCGQAPAGYGGYRGDFNSSHAYWDNLFLYYWLTGDATVVDTLTRGARSMRDYLCARRPAAPCRPDDPPADFWAQLTGRVAMQWFAAFRFLGLAGDDAGYLEDYTSGLARAVTQHYVEAEHGGMRYGFWLPGGTPVTGPGPYATDQLWMASLYDMNLVHRLQRDTGDAPIGQPAVAPSQVLAAWARTLVRFGATVAGDGSASGRWPNQLDFTWSGARLGGTLLSVGAHPGGGDPYLYDTGKATLTAVLVRASRQAGDASLARMGADLVELALASARGGDFGPLGKIQGEYLARLPAAIAGLAAPPGVVPSFVDVPVDHVYWPWIEALARSGLTGGCGADPPRYCPDQPVTRAQMAVFLLNGIHGAGYTPPPAAGLFADVPVSDPFAARIERLFAEGITGGCATAPPRYCPQQSVTRGQMAVFLLRARHGAGYAPPPVTGAFADVPPDHPFARWIEQLSAEGVTGGCGTGPARYCPDQPVTRGQMAVFLVRAFGLPL